MGDVNLRMLGFSDFLCTFADRKISVPLVYIMAKQILIPALTTLLTCQAAAAAQPLAYPAAPCDSTQYTVFGMTVNDPYRPLENDTASATLEWVRAENDLTGRWLAGVPFREDLRKRLTSLMDYVKNGLPWKGKDGLYYFAVNDGLRDQAVIYRAKEPYGSDAEVYIDPNTLSEDGTVALTGIFPSRDGRYTAYTISRSGSDWTEIYVMETATKRLLDDHIRWAKFTGAAWDDDGFYYSAYPAPEAGKEFSNANEYHSVFHHRPGTPQQQDTRVYGNPDEPLHFHTAGVTDDGKWLYVQGEGQGFGNALYVKRLGDNSAKWITIEPTMEYQALVVDATPDGRLLLFTSDGAPFNRLVSVDPSAPGRENWREVLPEQQGSVLTDVRVAGGHLVAVRERDASNHVTVHDMDGRQTSEIKLPTYGSVSVSADHKSPEIFYSFSSFTYPSEIYRCNTADGKSQLLKSTAVDGVVPGDYVTEQVFYTSADGTRVPMFLVYKKGLKRDGNNPVYLYGYGGFNISLNPGFSPSRMLWLENGGIYAQTNLRGGSEYGEAWHEAGTKMNKLNVFDDFIAAAEYMVAEGWTRPELLVAEGGSNGGLLVGAVVNRRPDLFAVAIPRVGVMDMLRYHLFTIGWNWASDYGTADDSPEMARYLLGYSPLHTIRNDGTPYPAVLVTTADHDDRVVPAHSFKYAATLQAADTGDRPKLIRIDSKAGHGAGKPVGKIIDEWTDIYSFIFSNLGITPAVSAK